MMLLVIWFFFFQAEDGIRDHCVTGVQTCALPICRNFWQRGPDLVLEWRAGHAPFDRFEAIEVAFEIRCQCCPQVAQIGRASCRERVEILGGAGSLKKKSMCGESRWLCAWQRGVVV